MRPTRNPLEFGAQLRAARQDQNRTQADVARAAKVSRAFVIDLENGKRPAAEFARVIAVARALGLSLALVDDPKPNFGSALDELLGGGRS